MRPRAFPERERRRFTRYRIASAARECVFSLQDGGRVLGRASDGAIFKLWTYVDKCAGFERELLPGQSILGRRVGVTTVRARAALAQSCSGGGLGGGRRPPPI